MKQLATKGDVKSARILAREVVRSNKQQDRLSVSKARLGSINNQLTQQMGTFFIAYYVRVIAMLMQCGTKLWRKLQARYRSRQRL